MRVTKRDFYSISLSFGGGSHTKKHKETPSLYAYYIFKLQAK
jgi:hypothetical protein